jgi:hypothetical protein
MRKSFPTLKESVFELAMENTKVGFRRDGKMTEVMWKNTIEPYAAVGAIKAGLSPAEGTYWTNRYLG